MGVFFAFGGFCVWGVLRLGGFAFGGFCVWGVMIGTTGDRCPREGLIQGLIQLTTGEFDKDIFEVRFPGHHAGTIALLVDIVIGLFEIGKKLAL